MDKIYTTIQGDTWDLIAYKIYGSEMVMDKLMQANTHLIQIAVFSAGTIVFLPDINVTEEMENKPPWMR